MKVSKYLLLKLALLFFLFPTFLAAQEEQSKLNGPVVKGIVEQFVSMHYSQKPLDDEMSLKIFKLYLNRLDPAHYYFLQDDVAEFRKYESRVDDMLRRGNANLALDIFERFKTRLSERLAMMENLWVRILISVLTQAGHWNAQISLIQKHQRKPAKYGAPKLNLIY
jgi:carboxyl-terminal processing protease